jgi:transposase
MKVCIDDFATKKRHTYGTVMVNIDTGCIVDMLESRESAEVTEWLSTFPNIEVVSRDGSPLYAAAIRTAHPNAMQISDRFHILKGLTDAARQLVLGIIGQRIAVPSDTAPSSYWLKQPRCDTDLPERLHNATTEKRTASIQEVRDLAAKGLNQKHIRELTGHCSTTVKKYINPDFEPEFKEYGVNYPSKLKPYCDTIDTMLNVHKTFREIEAAIREMGYCGSASTIRMYASRKRRHNQAAMAEFRENTEIIERKYLLKLLYNPIEKVKGITQEQLDKVITLHPQLLAVYDLIRDFKAIIAARHVDDIEQWLDSAKSLDSPDINSFVNGITRDIDAVRNAIIFDYSNGLAEGSVNKIKRIKHTMYGKASFSTLRTKTLMYEFWKSVN